MSRPRPVQQQQERNNAAAAAGDRGKRGAERGLRGAGGGDGPRRGRKGPGGFTPGSRSGRALFGSGSARPGAVGPEVRLATPSGVVTAGAVFDADTVTATSLFRTARVLMRGQVAVTD